MENMLDKALMTVLNSAKATSEKNGQIFANCARFFMSVLNQKWTSEEKEQEVLRKNLLKTLQKYSLTSEEYLQAYYTLYPKGETLPFGTKIEYDKDLASVVTKLKAQSQSKLETQTIKDALIEIFSSSVNSCFLVLIQVNKKRKEDINKNTEKNAEDTKAPFDPVAFANDVLDCCGVNSGNSYQVMDQFSPLVTNINKYVKEKKPLIFGFDKELLALETALSKHNKSAALIVGPAGTGKTSLVYKFAEAINDKNVPDEFKNVCIYELHLDAVLAGSMYRGQFEEKLMNILETAKALTKQNVILFIDEFHTITSAGGSTRGDVNASNIIKPYITRGDIAVIGASTNEEVNSFVESDKAISRRFSKILINEPTEEETEKIINQMIPNLEKEYGKKISNEIKKEIMKAASQYNIQVCNPDRTISMIETICAYAKVKRPEEKSITEKDIYEAIAISYNITATNNRFNETKKELFSKILGEEEPLSEVCGALSLIEYNLVNPKKPKAVLLLAGPTGTGKTETAKIIAKYYTGSENSLITVSGTSLIDKTSSSSLFGTNAGYVGFTPTSPFLAQVKQNPNCVVLFDEIEKADPDIFKSLLQILDEGFVEDKIGNKISFRNAIIIFTTNLGYGKSAYSGSGIMATPISSGSAQKEIEKHFSPEFIGRLNKIINYKYLSDAVIETLIERYRNKYNEYSKENITFDKEAIDRIKKNASINTLGARILEDCVKNEMLHQIELKLKKQEPEKVPA